MTLTAQVKQLYEQQQQLKAQTLVLVGDTKVVICSTPQGLGLSLVDQKYGVYLETVGFLLTIIQAN